MSRCSGMPLAPEASVRAPAAKTFCNGGQVVRAEDMGDIIETRDNEQQNESRRCQVSRLRKSSLMANDTRQRENDRHTPRQTNRERMKERR